MPSREPFVLIDWLISATKKRALEEDDDDDDKSSEVSMARDFARRGYNFEKHKEEPVKTSLTESKISR